MFWKLKNYVETVDGYLIRKDEAKMVKEGSDIFYYRKENAPAWDESYISFLYGRKYFKNTVEVSKDGTPVGYISLEEHSKIVDSFKQQLEIVPKYIGELAGIVRYVGDKPKRKVKKTKKSNNNKK